MPAPSAFLEARHVRLRAVLHERGLDGIIVTHPPNIVYLSNHTGTASAVTTSTPALPV